MSEIGSRLWRIHARVKTHQTEMKFVSKLVFQIYFRDQKLLWQVDLGGTLHENLARSNTFDGN